MSVDIEKNKLIATAFDYVRCGIGANYSRESFSDRMDEIYFPFVTLVNQLLESEKERDSLIAEREQLMKQEPIAYCYPLDAENLQTTECSVEVYSVPVGCPDGESTFALYAAPIPAQPSPAVAVPYLVTDQLRHVVADAFNAAHEQGRKNPAQKEDGLGIAVTMREMYVSSVDQILATPLPRITEQLPDCERALADFIASIGGYESSAWHDYPVDDVFRKGFAAASTHYGPRITEQGAREIAEAYAEYPHNFSSWLKFEGRALLEKLNVDKPEILQNQCDGCVSGQKVNNFGMHYDGDGRATILCQKGRYKSVGG